LVNKPCLNCLDSPVVMLADSFDHMQKQKE